jgi:hypothetical protein
MKKFIAILQIIFALCCQRLFSQAGFYDLNTIEEVRITIKEKNWTKILDSLLVTGDGEGRLIGDISINGKELKRVGIRYKGFSSWNKNEIKNPFNVDLDYTIKNQNYQGFTKLKLSNVIHDPSFIREVLGYEIARKYLPASRANYANLYVNDTLIGLYTNVEAVDKNFVEKNYASKDHTFFKGSPEKLIYPFGQNSNLAYTHGTDTTGYIPFYKLESDYGWKDILELIYILYKTPGEIESILNVDRTLWMHAFNYAILNLDSYIGYSQNYYMYKDDNGRFNPIIWDLNMSFGSFRHSDGSDHYQGLTIKETKEIDPLQHLSFSISPRPLMTVLFKNVSYRKMYLAHLRTIIKENFVSNEYYRFGQQAQQVIQAAVQNDTNKFYSDSDFNNNIDSTVGGTGSMDEYPGIKDLMNGRIAYLTNYPGFEGAPVITDIGISPTLPEFGVETRFTVKVSGAGSVILAYRFKTDGIFSKTVMYDDGIHNDGTAGDSIYGISIIPAGHIIQYYFYAENDSAGIFSPERAENEFYTLQPRILPGDIVINEIWWSWLRGRWIELFNNTKENLSLKGLYLADDSNLNTKWPLPNTTITSNGYLLIFEQNTTLIFDSYDGDISLAYDDSHIIDHLQYNLLIPGKSYGRYPNGLGSFDFMEPSPSMHNYLGTTPSTDFAVFPNPTNSQVVVEIKNPGTPMTIEILNINGQPAHTEIYCSAPAGTTVIVKVMDVSQLQNGIYFIRIVCQDDVMIKKLCIHN